MQNKTIKTDVVVVGKLFCDVIFSGLPKFPELGKEIYADGLTITTGGGAFISSAYFHLLNRDAAVVAEVGNDIFSKVIIDDFKRLSLSDQLIRKRNQPYYSVTIGLPFDNERAFVTKTDLNPPQKSIADILKNVEAKHIHISDMAMLAEYPDILTYAKQNKLTTSLDTVWDENTLQQNELLTLLCDLDVLITNEFEALYITKQNLQKGCLITAASELEKLAPIIVIKRGEKGAIAADNSGKTTEHPALKVKVVDTVGAGDAFNAGFIHQYLHNQPLKQCLKLGTICGSLSTTFSGGASQMPNFETIKQLYMD